MRHTLLLLAALTTACDDYAAVQEADSIEAYEAWLADNTVGPKVLIARARLEELYLEQAASTASLDAYDRYLERFPEGTQLERAQREREALLWSQTRAADSIEAYQAFLDAYPRGDKDRRSAARVRIPVLEYLEHLELAPVTTERINLAEDPKGELNGWAIRTTVTNRGPDTLDKLVLTAVYTLPGTETAVRKAYPVAATSWPMPLEDVYSKPLNPGESRAWAWTTGDLPEDWSGEAKVEVTGLARAK